MYALMALVMTWPLALHIGDAVLGPPGDNLEYVWKMWWFKQALLEQRVSPFFVPDVFYPFGYPLALSETTTAHTVLGLPLTVLWGEVAAYNLLMIASFVLSGYGVYLLVGELGASVLGAAFAGLAFAFCPYRMAHLGAGHLPLMGTGWIALLLWAIERLIRRPTVWRGVVSGMFAALMALSSWYYAAVGGLFGVGYVLLRARPWRTVLLRHSMLVSLLLAGIVCAILVAPAAVPLIGLYREGQAQYSRSLAYVDRWSASPVDFVYPNAMHPIWGQALTSLNPQNIHENMLYLGLVSLVLAGVGVWSRWREAATKVYVILALATFVLALGTTLHLSGKPVYVSVPPAVEQQFSRVMHVLTSRLAVNKMQFSSLRRDAAIVLPMPALWLYLYLPFLSAMRVWTRFGILTMLSVSVVAAWGLDAFLARFRGRLRGTVAGGVTCLLLLDLAVLPYPYGYTKTDAQPVDLWLAHQALGSPVAAFPLERTWNGSALAATRFHRQPVAYGYGSFTPRQFAQVRPTLSAWPSTDTLELLREWGIRYVLVGARSYGDRWPSVRSAIGALPGVREVATWEETERFRGDRLLGLLPEDDAVPATEKVAGQLAAYLRDEIHVYAID